MKFSRQLELARMEMLIYTGSIADEKPDYLCLACHAISKSTHIEHKQGCPVLIARQEEEDGTSMRDTMLILQNYGFGSTDPIPDY